MQIATMWICVRDELSCGSRCFLRSVRCYEQVFLHFALAPKGARLRSIRVVRARFSRWIDSRATVGGKSTVPNHAQDNGRHDCVQG